MAEFSGQPLATRVIAALYLCLMLAGCLFAASGIVVAIQRYDAAFAVHGADWSWFSGWYIWSHAGTGVALLALTALFGIAFVRRPFRLVAPLAYVLSYGLCGTAFLAVLESAWKGDTPEGVPHALIGLGAMFILPALVASGGLLFWATRRRG